MAGRPNWRLTGVAVIVAAQATAAVYFVIDSLSDLTAQPGTGFPTGGLMECLVAFALAAGVIFGFRHVMRLNAEARSQRDALGIAQGALAEHVMLKFREWKLSPGEADVALLALKGFQIAEIAKLRGAAAGTIRSQLSQIYNKASVNSQSMLLALFFDDLLQIDMTGTTGLSNSALKSDG